MGFTLPWRDPVRLGPEAGGCASRTRRSLGEPLTPQTARSLRVGEHQEQTPAVSAADAAGAANPGSRRAVLPPRLPCPLIPLEPAAARRCLPRSITDTAFPHSSPSTRTAIGSTAMTATSSVGRARAVARWSDSRCCPIWPTALIRSSATTHSPPVQPRRSWCSSMAATGTPRTSAISCFRLRHSWTLEIAFVSANYPLCPEVGIPELINSCRQCIAHIHRNAGRFGGDPDRIHVAGHSAGAHIAAMLLSAERASSGKPTAPAPIRGALAISGVYDLTPIRYLAMNERLRIPARRCRFRVPYPKRPQARMPPRSGSRGWRGKGVSPPAASLCRRMADAWTCLRRNCGGRRQPFFHP